jgi:type I restriction enzyme M protein
VSWKGYEKDIKNDKTGRFKYLPSISDGQLLFMQHLISKLDAVGMGVVVHNGSTLFSGDAGSAESNIRKWMLDSDIVEAVIQLPTDEFFNTGIYTYLWVLNKNKQAHQKNKIMLINASEKFKPLKKSKGSKRKEVDEVSRIDIVATLTAYQDNDYARVFDKEYFYFNKQAIMLTNVDEKGRTFEVHLPMKEDKFGGIKRDSSLKLPPTQITQGDIVLTEFCITQYDTTQYASLENYCAEVIKPQIAQLDYKEQPLVISTEDSNYYYDPDKETLIKEANGQKEELGCGKIIVSASYKKATKKLTERIEISVELTADYQKDYEIIPFHKDPVANQAAIEAFMVRYISKPFVYLENVVGVELNFNKIFYKPETLRPVSEIAADIAELDKALKALEAELAL